MRSSLMALPVEEAQYGFHNYVALEIDLDVALYLRRSCQYYYICRHRSHVGTRIAY